MMKEAIDTSPSRRQVLRLAAMVTAWAAAAKAPGIRATPEAAFRILASVSFQVSRRLVVARSPASSMERRLSRRTPRR
jgi:hypothetical protein